MRFRGTLIVMLLAAALGAWVYFHEVRGGAKRAHRKAQAESLLGIDRSAPTAIRVTHTGTVFDLQKRGEVWMLLRPTTAPADPRLIVAYLDTLAAAKRDEHVGGGDLVRYGLDAPAAVVEIDAGGRTRKLSLGRINPLQTLVYVLVDDDKDVYLTTSSLLTMSLANAFGWRDKRMIDTDPEKVDRMTFTTLNAGKVSVRRDPQHGWRVEGDVPFRADPRLVQNLVTSLARLETVGIVQESKAEVPRYGLDNRRQTAVLEQGGRVVGDLVTGLAEGGGKYFAIVPDKPEIFRVDGRVVDAWYALARQPRDPLAFTPFVPDAVTRIRVETPDDHFELRRLSAVDWQVAESQRADSTLAIAPGMIDALLADLATIEVAGWPERQPPPGTFEPATLRILLFADAQLLAGLEIGSKDPRSLHIVARGPGEPAAFLLSPADLMRLPLDLDKYKSGETPAPADADRG